MDIGKGKSVEGINSSPAVAPKVPFETGNVFISSQKFRGSHTWTIKRFSEIKERKILSTEFDIGTYRWRLLIFPNGNDNRDKQKSRTVAIYLCFCHAHFTPEFLNPKVNFEITVVNQLQAERSITLGAQHTFSKRAPDWGFTRILLKEDLQQPEIGFLVKDTLILHAHLTVIPRRMPRNETGFVGLTGRDQDDGLNAALQVLFHIPYFRKAIYSVNSSETLATGTRLPHALRRLFFKLQYQNSTVSTKEIVKILEHCEAKKRFSSLLEKLLLELMGSNVEKVIPNLFQGQSFTCIENASNGESQTCHEKHKQIELLIDGCKDLYEALENRCKVMKVEGSIDEHRYTLFDTLPSILHIDLKLRDCKKIQSTHNESSSGGFTISEDLNMDYGGKRFFSSNSGNKTVKNAYKLHSMFVSTITGCHFVYIKRQDTWFRFEDEQVFQVEPEEVFEAHCKNGEQRVDSLMYIRTSDLGQIMWETSKDDIAESIRKLFEDCLYEKEKDITEKQTANSFMVFNVATDYDFKKKSLSRIPTDLVQIDSVKKFRVSRDATFEDFRNIVGCEYGIPPSCQRYWLWKTTESGSVRIDRLFPPLAQDNKKMLSLHTIRDPLRSSDKKSNALMVINLYLELPGPEKNALHDIKPDEILLFIKFYDPLHVEMQYLGSLYVGRKDSFRSILPRARALSNLPKDLEISACKLAALEPHIVLCDIFDQSTPEQNELKSGDVVIVQPKMIPLTKFLKERYTHGAFSDDML